jgi:glycosyltransferase involved in cell wall biosynthesis
MRVHQMTATLVEGDAVSNDVLAIDRCLKTWGLDSHIYAENIEPCMAAVCQTDQAYEPFLNDPDDVLIYHYSIYCPNLELYQRSANRKIVIYHNITPAEFFRGFDDRLEALCRLGRAAMPRLIGCDLALAVSQFNRRELIEVGIPASDTDVMPIFLSLDKFEESGRNARLWDEMTTDGQTHFLYVGRLAPNKRCEDLIKLLYVYRKHIDEQAHLWLVGDTSFAAYVHFLEALIARLGLRRAVTFSGRVPISDLRTYYEASSAFLCASRHEGFGVPLVECMYFGLPILAYRSAAVPETLGEAGLMFTRWQYPEVAEMLHFLATDATLRRQIIAGQRQRLAAFAPQQVALKLREALARVGAL